MRRFIGIGIMVLISALALTACGGKTIKVNGDDNGSTFEMKQGETLVVSIDGNPTTGYNWEVDSVDENILKSAGEPDYKSDSQLVGSGGTFKFKFTAAAAGATTLILKYWRSFEPDNPPVETFEITVNVK